MYLLAIETTGPSGSAALLDEEGNVLACAVSEEQMSHLKKLMPMIQSLLTQTGVSKQEISYVAPSIGPGSFTGIRIGVSTARALCQGLELTYGIPVPTLEGFLYKEEARRQSAQGNIVCAIINARRGQVYGVVDGFMKPGSYMLNEVLTVIQENILTPQNIIGGENSKSPKVIFFGDGVDAYEAKIKETLGEENLHKTYEFAEKSIRYQDAASVGMWALANGLRDGKQTEAAVPYQQMLPDYMRKAEAEEKLAKGQLPICRGPKQE